MIVKVFIAPMPIRDNGLFGFGFAESGQLNSFVEPRFPINT